MAKAKANVGKRGSIGVSLSLNALIGILLAIIGTFLVFYRASLKGTIQYLVIIIAVFLICVGFVAFVNFFKYKRESSNLLIGIFEMIIGVALFFAPVTNYLLLGIGSALILYGIAYIIRYHKLSTHFMTAILFVTVGVLLLLTHWISNEIFLLIVGIFALVGAAYYLMV